MSETLLQQILDRIRTVDRRLDGIDQRLSLQEQTLTNRLQALEATQWSLLRRRQTYELDSLLETSLQQRINDLSARVTKLELKAALRSSPS